MIGRLIGQIAEKNPEGVLLDVGGVGYDVSLPLGTLAGLPPTGQETTLYIHTYVREDVLRLFGFVSTRDRTAFRTMLKVSGVGPKLAVAVLGALSGNQLAEVIQNGDVRRLSAIPGIGKKTAERLIMELGGKLGLEPTEPGGPGGSVLGDLASALKNLGFKAAHVEQTLEKLGRDGAAGEPFEKLLRKALGLLQGK